MKSFIGILLVLFGISAGAGLGVALRPGETEVVFASGQETAEAGAFAANHPTETGDIEYLHLGRKFFVPVVEGDTTRALVMLDLAVSVPVEHRNEVYAAEPRLRDTFLRILFEYSYTGAFFEKYTEARRLNELRKRLREAAKIFLPGKIVDVLIIEIIRKDL